MTYAARHQDEEIFSLITSLASQYPGDTGLFAPLLLNTVTLQPGEAMYLDACTPHAYVRGTGLEIMASSDNVLRAGSPLKYIDVPELLACTRFVAKPANQVLLSPSVDNLVQHFRVPVPDFTFSIYPAGKHNLITASAEILCHRRLCDPQAGHQRIVFGKGNQPFIPAATGDYQLLAEGQVARAGNRS